MMDVIPLLLGLLVRDLRQLLLGLLPTLDHLLLLLVLLPLRTLPFVLRGLPLGSNWWSNGPARRAWRIPLVKQWLARTRQRAHGENWHRWTLSPKHASLVTQLVA